MSTKNQTTNYQILMNENIKKIAKHEQLSKLLLVNEIFKNEVDFAKKDFAHSLKMANLLKKAMDNFANAEVKKALKDIKIEYKSKYAYIFDVAGYSKTQAYNLYNLANVDAETLKKFMENESIKKTIENCLSFANGKDVEEVNTKATKPKLDTSKTEKPKKVSTEAKHVETSIHKGATKEEVKELIKILMEQYKIEVHELEAVEVVAENVFAA